MAKIEIPHKVIFEWSLTHETKMRCEISKITKLNLIKCRDINGFGTIIGVNLREY